MREKREEQRRPGNERTRQSIVSHAVLTATVTEREREKEHVLFSPASLFSFSLS